jgi:osmotically-inducible protein OsmY
MRPILVVPLLALAAACERPDLPPSEQVLARSARTDEAREAVGPATPRAQPAEAPSPEPLPPPEALTDEAISSRIGTELAGDPGMAGSDVTVHTDKGVVTLSGTVKSHEQTGIASAHAQRQDGVMRVDNHLRPALS